MTRRGMGWDGVRGGRGGLPSGAEGTAAGAPAVGRANASRRRGAVWSCGDRRRWTTSHAAEPEAGEEEKTCPVWGGGAAERITDERRARKCEESGFYAFYAAASVTIHVTFRNSFILS